uniref:Uncharacterized protein n=1 Tax=Kalanchoe fedtschenkoi TaxID=63787 RepID=A0A7N0V0S8_KALFE
MPLPFEIEGKGVLDFEYSDSVHHHPQSELLLAAWTDKQLLEQASSCCHLLGSEPTSVLDARRSLSLSPSPPNSTSTLSSSLGSSGSGRSTAVAGQEKCGVGMDEFENVLSDFGAGVAPPGATPSPDQSLLGYFFGDHDQVHDPGLVSFNKFMQGSVAPDFDMGTGMSESCSTFPLCNNGSVGYGSIPNAIFGQLGSNTVPVAVSQHQHQYQQLMGSFEEKPQVFNPNFAINQHQIQPSENPSLFLPMGFGQQEHHGLILPPHPKRLNTGMMLEQGVNNLQIPKIPFSLQNQHDPGIGHKLQLHSNPPPTRFQTGMTKGRGEEALLGSHQQAMVEDIFKAVELIQVGNLVLAQGILARLNHQLSPIGKPFQRIAFYFKESLQLLLEMNGNSSNVTTSTALSNYSPSFGHILKIGAYKSFSEASPVVHFANFTCNQAILESVEGFDKIHVVDFDIGYGGQWASLMQELALRNGGTPSLKITAFASPSTHDDLEFGLVLENLNQFASEVKLKFELRIGSLDALTSMPLHVSNGEGEAIVVNLPVAALSCYPMSLPLVLRVVKQLSPKIVVSLDRGCDRNDLPFPHHTVHALQSYTALLESLDASVMNLDALQKIERFFIHPSIERMLVSRHLCPEKISPWRSIFLSSGFSPYQFSNITESQADYLVQRTPAGGFHVEKRQSSIVLCWQQKELVSASAWRC